MLLCFNVLLLNFVFKKWREEQKQNASIIFEEHCDTSHWNKTAAGLLTMFRLFKYFCV